MSNKVKKGDWVKGFHKGYFEVVGFGENYAFRDEEYYQRGDRISTMVNLKQGFSENMRFKLGADSVAEEWVFPVSKDIRDKIDL